MWRALLEVFTGRRRIFRVRGDSMSPLYRDGDYVWVRRVDFRRRPPGPGDVVVARHPFRPGLRILKQVRECRSDGTVFLVGLHGLASTDSRSFGPLPLESLEGRVERRFGRRG